MFADQGARAAVPRAAYLPAHMYPPIMPAPPTSSTTAQSSPTSDNDGKPRRKLRVVDRGREACNECRHHKIRCHPHPDDPEHTHPCARCSRMSLECVFKKHNRGRKRKNPIPDDSHVDEAEESDESGRRASDFALPYSRIQTSASRESARPSPMLYPDVGKPAVQTTHSPEYDPRLGGGGAERDVHHPHHPHQPFTLSNSRYPFMAVDSSARLDAGPSRPRLHAPVRTMSLRHMLETDDEDDGDDVARRESRGHDRADIDRRAGAVEPLYASSAHTDGAAPLKDPVDAGYVSEAEAATLFDIFVRHFHPSISLLDPAVHTHDNTRRTMPALYTAMLAVASRYLPRLPVDAARRISPDVPHSPHQLILALAHEHVARAMADATSSLSVVQAMIVLGLWKGPDDDKAGYLCNRAVVLAREMRLGRIFTSHELARLVPHERREVRRRQRTWLTLFTINMIFHQQFHAPLLIPPSDPLVTTVDHWLRHADRDMILSETFISFSTDLRRRYLQWRELLKPSEDMDAPPPSALSLSVLSKTMNAEWDVCTESWIRDMIDVGGTPGHLSKPRVWTSALRLNLNLIAVNQTLRIPLAERIDARGARLAEHYSPPGSGAAGAQLTTVPAFHHCLNAATSVLVRMAALDKEQITYAPDTLLHFALYAATFLWSLCRTPDAYGFDEQEVDHCRQLILKTADLLDEASAYESSSPALHARRLRRLCRESPDLPSYAGTATSGTRTGHAAAAAAAGYTQPVDMGLGGGAGVAGLPTPQTASTYAPPAWAADAAAAAPRPTDLDLLLGDYPWTGLAMPWGGGDGSMFGTTANSLASHAGAGGLGILAGPTAPGHYSHDSLPHMM